MESMAMEESKRGDLGDELGKNEDKGNEVATV